MKDRTILVHDLSCETEMYWWYLMIPEYWCAFHKSLQPRNELQPITLFSTCSTPSTANSAEVSGIPELQEVYGYVYFTQRIYLNNSVGSSNQNAQVEVRLGVHHDSWQWQWPPRWGWWRWWWRWWWSYEWHQHIRHLARVDLLEDYMMVPRPPSCKSISWHRCCMLRSILTICSKYQLPCITYIYVWHMQATCTVHALIWLMPLYKIC